MKPHTRISSIFLLVTAWIVAGALAACSPQDSPAKPAASVSTPAQALEQVASIGKGFTVGSMMSANTVYVLFDPQCPHCGHLWQAAMPLQNKARFVWIPVSIMNGKSAPQGAALMSSANPAELMSAHEASLLAGTGGTPAPSSMAPDVEAAIKVNTQLFTRLGLESIPFVVAKNARTGQAVSKSGAMSTAALSEFLGLE
jgi:thiol:disulfide interchange protein DsbG